MTLDLSELLTALLSVMMLILWINYRLPRHRDLRRHNMARRRRR
jgi:hypothetical protein